MVWVLLVVFLTFGCVTASPAEVLETLWALNVGTTALYFDYGHATLGVRTWLCTVLHEQLIWCIFGRLVGFDYSEVVIC